MDDVRINYQRFLNTQQAYLRAKFQRGMLVLVGTDEWLNDQITSTFNNSAVIEPLIYSEKKLGQAISKPVINNKNYRQQLGSEHYLILFDGSENFNVDAFAALSGTLVAGGVLILLLTQKDVKQSAFLQRFICCAQRYQEIKIVNQDEPLPNNVAFDANDFAITSIAQSAGSPSFNFYAKTIDQQLAVEKILKVANGHRNRPLVITADRGRGKSTALALASAELLEQGNKLIIISAPHPSAISVVFTHLKKRLPKAQFLHNEIRYNNASVQFLPLDVLVKDKPKCHVLFIDEAAGIPISMLMSLLDDHHRPVFVSTVHGYEGAGRGFSTKFLQHLLTVRPEANLLHMNQPIRWSADDPLEAFTFDALMLNAQLNDTVYSSNPRLKYRLVRHEELASAAELIEQVFALLVTAHYQTKPSDLKMLLDDPQVSIAVVEQQNTVLGVVLLLAEGDVDDQLAQQVKQSLRRIKGHFLPQSLLVHNGIEDAFQYRYQRIVRVAVHPLYQSNGIGSKLLNYCFDTLLDQGVDFLGSSFGVNSKLLNFWHSNGFSVARIGFSKDSASGEHSALVLKPLTANAEALNHQLDTEFYQNLTYYLADEYAYLHTDLVVQLLRCKKVNTQIDVHDVKVMNDFINGYRQWSNCAPAIYRSLPGLLKRIDHCNHKCAVEYQLLIRKVLQKHSVKSIAEEFTLSGKKSVNLILIKAVKTLLVQSKLS